MKYRDIDWPTAKAILATLKMEPFIFLYVLALNVFTITNEQLIQDKICVNKYNKSHDYCIEISSKSDEEDRDETKSLIFGDLAQFMTYTSIIKSVPNFFLALFVGPWIDRYIGGRKVILMAGLLGHSCWFGLHLLNAIRFEWDVNYILLAYIPMVATGGASCLALASWSYMTNNCPKEYRFIKFTVYELAYFVGGLMGTYIGGWLLGSGNLHTSGHLHNYERVFVFCLITSLVGCLWILFVVNENKRQIGDKSQEVNRNDDEMDSKDKQIETKVINSGIRFSKLFDFANIKDLFKTVVKVRPNRGRTQLWLLYLSMNIISFADVKDMSIIFPYVENMYGWNGQHFSSIMSLGVVVQMLSFGVISYIFSHYLKLNDPKLGLIGIVLNYCGCIAIATILSPIGFYLMFPLCSCVPMATVAVRALLSKVGTESESGKIFCVLGALENICDSLESLITNNLFRFSIDFYPTLCFDLAAGLVFPPLFVFIWIDLTRSEP